MGTAELSTHDQKGPFSGKVLDDGAEYSEASMNVFPSSQIAKRFDTDDYQVLIVAEKFQTGFDQPLLHTMYVDRRLAGIQAFQTLSRLNRMHPGKKETFVLDFVNDPEEIKAAFQPYYERTLVDEQAEPKQLYELQAELDKLRLSYRDTYPDIIAINLILYNRVGRARWGCPDPVKKVWLYK